MAAPNTPCDEAKCQQTLTARNPPKWNRAIPESGYIRLGSIRYGVKMTVTENGICAPLKQPITAATVAAAAAEAANHAPRGNSTHSDAISSIGSIGSTAFDDDYADEEACCCLGANTPLTASGPCSNNRHRQQATAASAVAYLPAKCRSTVATSKIAQNRIQPSSSVPHHQHHQHQQHHAHHHTSEPTTTTSTLSRTTHPSTTQPTTTTTTTISAATGAAHVGAANQSSTTLCAQRSTTSTATSTPNTTTNASATGGHLVIGSRESSPTPLTTCCYYSVPTRIAQPFKPAAAASPINNKPTANSDNKSTSSSSSIASGAPIISSGDTTTAASGVAPPVAHHRRRIPIAHSATSTPPLSVAPSSPSPSSSSSSAVAAAAAAQRQPSASSISERLGASAFNYSSHRNSAESSADALSSRRLLLGSTSNDANTHGDRDDGHDHHNNDGAADRDDDHDDNNDTRHPLCVRETATANRTACTSRRQQQQQVQQQRTLENECYCHNKASVNHNNNNSSLSGGHSAVGPSSPPFGEPSLTARRADFTVVVRSSNGHGNNTTSCRGDYINRPSYQNHKARQIFGNSIAPHPQAESEGQNENNVCRAVGVAVDGADTVAALRRKITPQKIPTIIATYSSEQRHQWQSSVDDDVHTQITLSPTSTTPATTTTTTPATTATTTTALPIADRRNGKDNNSGDAAADDEDDNSHISLKYDDLCYIDSSVSDFSSNVAVAVNEVRHFAKLTPVTPTSTTTTPQLPPQLPPQPPSPTTSTHSSAITNCRHTPATPTTSPSSSIPSGIPKPSLLDSGGPKINSVTFKSLSANNNHSTADDGGVVAANTTTTTNTAVAVAVAVAAERGRPDRLVAVATQSERNDGDVDITSNNRAAADCVDTHRLANGHSDATAAAAAAAADRARLTLRSQTLGSSGRLSQVSNSSGCGSNSFTAIRTTPVRLRSLVTDTADIEQAELRSRSRHLVAEDVFPKSVSCFGRAAEERISNSANSPTMDKRRKTLDRWQRLGFGRRSASNITIADRPTSSSHSTSNATSDSADMRKSSEKTERLKEITEMLKSSRAQSQPAQLQTPPVPPPRKPRSPNPSASNSGSMVSLTPDDPTAGPATSASQSLTPAIPSSTYAAELPRNIFQDSLKALSKSFRSSHHDVRAPAHAVTLSTANELPVVHPNKFNVLPVDEEDAFTALPIVDSRSSLSAYPSHKHMPHRSASFSQVDYSSGKYIRSALGALKASIMKHKEPSVVDSANLTLPRKKDREADADVIAETDDSVSYIFLTDKPDRLISASAAIVSVVETTTADQLLAPPVREPSPLVVVSASEIVLDTLCEEEICDQSQLCDEEFLQTATTCLIPVPVYECVGRDWPCGEDEPEVWMNVNEDDGVKHIEEYNVNTERITSAEIRMELVADILPRLDEELVAELSEETAPQPQEQPLPLIDIQTSADESSPTATPNPPITSKHNKFERSNTWSCPPSDCTAAEQLPAISVTSGSSNEFDELHTMAGDERRKPHTATDSPNRLSTEFVEVRKRHSNEDKPFESSLESINPSPSDERIKRIDKSKRRKGIYIQHDSECWHLAEQGGTSSPIPTDVTSASIWSVLSGADADGSTDALNPLSLVENLAQLGCKSLATVAAGDADRQSPLSALGSLEPTTPDSENSGRLQWPKCSRRQSLTGQSSEEKDDQMQGAVGTTVGAVIPSGCNYATPATPDTQHRTPLLFSRSDSVSDTESFDRTAPRERCSQSPVPGDTDLKRYSKRPLRGPYGLMLEAEMKKPTKLPYDEILEELNRADNAIKRKESDDYLRQQKLVRKNSGYLPVPSHQRASSTPVHMDTTAKEPLHSNHRRFPSCIDSSTDLKKEFKKMSLDSSMLKEPLRTPKKCASLETNINAGASSAKRTSKDEPKSQFTVHRKDDASPNTLKATPELLAQLLKGSSEKLVAEQFERKAHQSPGESITLPTALLKCLDTRTHVVIELFNTETSYVESLEHMVQKYMQPLRSAEHAGLVDKQAVDEIFYMIPALQRLHERFLDDLQTRLNSWSESQTQIGVAFIEAFSDSDVFDTYMTFLNNLHRATATLRTSRVQRPPFGKFLNLIARQHKGKLELDSLLIKPVQKFPSYELILMRLIKYTADDHPDAPGLHKAFNLVHDMLVTLNCKKREEFEKGQREAVVREIEGVIEGVSDLVTPDRQFLLFDLVSIVPASHTGRKDRGLFLFNDLLIVTSIKRRSGNLRKASSSTVPSSVAQTLDTNKYKLIMKIPIDDLDIVKIKDENLQKLEREIEFLANDLKKLQQINDVTNTLRCPHQALEDSARELHRDIQRQLTDRQTNDPQLSILDLSLHSSTELLSWSVMFAKADKKTQWEQTLLELKQKIAASLECPPAPEFLTSIPIRKTRAGLQFTCAAPTLAGNGTGTGSGTASDVWVCNSDGYVGQVCVLSLAPEPSVISCNSVCNARILCVESVPHSVQSRYQPSEGAGAGAGSSSAEPSSKSLPDLSSSGDEAAVASAAAAAVASSSTSVAHVPDGQQSTMWLGMEDGYVHVYNCSDNIRIKNTKIKMQHGSAVTDILYLDNQIFVSLANGDVVVYIRENDIWQTAQPETLSVGSVAQPVTQMLRVGRTLWCSANGTVKMLDTLKRTVDYEFRVSDKPITNMVLCGDKVWLSIKNTAFVECYHGTNFNLLHKVNLAPQVTKMLFACDEIIRQHKAACLRVTSMLACNNLIWIGTSAGVVLTVRTVEKASAGMVELPCVTGLPHGHTGHVRVLTCVEFDGTTEFTNKDLASKIAASGKLHTASEDSEGPHMLVISGGDGYENFRPNSAASALNDCAGREDSTNHLLIWQA